MIVDTAGRLQIDEALMDELARVRDEAKPTNVVLVLDAMTGQEAVNVAVAFEERIDFDGVILTKLDGDARGGAALSVKSVTDKPILFASTGEKLDALEVFHPDRMASRILGMGDVLTLIERAEQAASEDEQAAMEERMRKGQFTFDDFLSAQKMLRRMGPLQGVLKLIPGLGNQLAGRRHGREQAEARRGDRALDDAAGAGHAARHRRPPPPAHRARLGHDGRRGQPPDGGAQDDGEDDEADGQGQRHAVLPGHARDLAASRAGSATAARPPQQGGMSSKERQRKKKAKRKASRR